MSRLPRIVPVALAILLTGCASASGDPFAGTDDRSIQVEVVNMNFNDATLYAIRAGQRIRMGIVTGAQTETFTVRWPTSYPLRVEIRLLGGQRCVTRELPTDPGDHVYMEISQNLMTDPQCTRR